MPTLLFIRLLLVAGLVALTSSLLSGMDEANTPVELTQLLSEARIQAQEVRDQTSRLVLLQNLAAAEARIGNLRTATSEVERLEPLVKSPPLYGDCNYIYLEILRTQARTGDYAAAYRTIERITKFKDEAYFALAEELARGGHLEKARAAVEQTSRPDNLRRRSQVILALAVAAVNSGDSNGAAPLFNEAERLSTQLLQQAGVQAATIELTLDVAAKRYACGTSETENRMFSASRALISGIPDESRRQQYMYMLASAAAQGGDFDLAQQVASQIGDPMRSAQAGAEIVRAYLIEGLEDTTAAFKVASDISGLEVRVSSLALVASAQARNGQRLQAISTIETCQKLLEYASSDFKPWGKLSLADAEYELGRKARAAQLSNEAIKLASGLTIHPERERPLLLRSIARLRASFGDEAGALKTARHSGDPSSFEDMAEAEAKAGRAKSALKWIERLRDPEQKASALLGIVRGVLEQQRSNSSSTYPRCK